MYILLCCVTNENLFDRIIHTNSARMVERQKHVFPDSNVMAIKDLFRDFDDGKV
jgi:uncharacterized protein YabN with tetrapyrrole methylase and pyrophosphatase domain